MTIFKSNGKLLLTGEYVILDGAISLAIPSKYGQSLVVEAIDRPVIQWHSYNEKKELWFEGEFNISDTTLKPLQHCNISERIVQIFTAALQLNPEFLNQSKGYKIETHLDFPTNWGLGTSSTLINNMAEWANVNAFKLLDLTFGGSGYDIACAKYNTPITYQIKNSIPQITPVNFNPHFKEHLYFIHLNKKQNSREGIAHYKAQNKKDLKNVISKINNITSNMVSCGDLESYQKLLDQHEQLVSKITNQTTVKDQFFNDFKGSIKSLGAWGGDFILVATKECPRDYFEKKGYKTIISYNDMVL